MLARPVVMNRHAEGDIGRRKAVDDIGPERTPAKRDVLAFTVHLHRPRDNLLECIDADGEHATVGTLGGELANVAADIENAPVVC